MKRGFTLVEVITCLAIIAIVAAIAAPVFSQAKRSAKITASISNLHQMHLALKLYQFEHEGDGKYGKMAEMGLPTGEVLMRQRLGLPLEIWKSPCGQNPSWAPVPVVIQYDYYPDSGLDHFETIAPSFQENLIVLSDMHCADHGDPLYSDFVHHRGLGVLLSGALKNLNKPGDSRWQKWWSLPLDL